MADTDLRTAAQALADAHDTYERALATEAENVGIADGYDEDRSLAVAAAAIEEQQAWLALRAALAAATEPPTVDAARRMIDEVTAEHAATWPSCNTAHGAGPVPDPQGTDEPKSRSAVGRFGYSENLVVGAPDEPTDDDGWKLRDLAAQHEQLERDHQRALDKIGEMGAEVERLRAAAPASEDDEREIEVEHDVILSVPERPSIQLDGTIEVVERAAGSPPPTPGPTREQVELVLSRHWGGDGTTRVTEATDAVMALWSTRPATVLARLVTYDAIEGPDQSVVPSIVIPHPTGTRVQVVAVTEDTTPTVAEAVQAFDQITNKIGQPNVNPEASR